MGKAARALVAISDRENREALVQALAACGFEPIFCSTLDEVRAILASEATDVLFCDNAFADSSFDDLPRDVSSGELRPLVIVCSRVYDPAIYLEVVYRGAFDFIIYPYRTDEVRWILGTAFRISCEPAPKPKVNSGRVTSSEWSRHVTD
jgi:DNA-binding NtrC family response regulator